MGFTSKKVFYFTILILTNYIHTAKSENGCSLLAGSPEKLSHLMIVDLFNPAKADDSKDGLILTRLVAFVDRTATVGKVNSALKSVNALICSSSPNASIMSLSIPKAKNLMEINAIAKKLESSGAFIAVYPAYTIKFN